MIKIVWVWYIFINFLAFALYGLDKTQARINGRRISEKTLHSLALTGGFAGGMVGMYYFRHKTKKPLFLWVMVISVVIHLFFWIYY